MKANTEIFLTKLIVFCNTCLGKRSSFLVFMGLKSYNFLCLAINHAGIVRNTILLAHSYGKRKCWNQNFFYRKLTGIVWMKQGLSNFDSSPLTCEPFEFPDKNSPNIANRIFPGKARGDKALILANLDSPTAEVFPH